MGLSPNPGTGGFAEDGLEEQPVHDAVEPGSKFRAAVYVGANAHAPVGSMGRAVTEDTMARTNNTFEGTRIVKGDIRFSEQRSVG